MTLFCNLFMERPSYNTSPCFIRYATIRFKFTVNCDTESERHYWVCLNGSQAKCLISCPSELYGVPSVTCHMGSHIVTCHPTQVNAPRLNPSQTGRYSFYLLQRDGRLSWPEWLVICRNSLYVCSLLVQVVTGSAVEQLRWYRDQRVNHYSKPPPQWSQNTRPLLWLLLTDGRKPERTCDSNVT